MVTFRASIFDVNGVYLGETPVWLGLKEPNHEGYMSMHLANFGPLWPYAADQNALSPMTYKTMNFAVRRHSNGGWKFRIADSSTQTLFDEMMAEAQRW